MNDLATRESSVAPRDWFARWFDEWPPFPRWPELWRGRFFDDAEPMRVEERQEGDTLIVRAEMPGLDPDKDVDISISDQMLHIQAERRQESKVEEDGRYRSEFRYGRFARSVPLPAGAPEADVKASYKDGILEVRIPLDHAKETARKIAIERS